MQGGVMSRDCAERVQGIEIARNVLPTRGEGVDCDAVCTVIIRRDRKKHGQ
jgi:hypothetical protein